MRKLRPLSLLVPILLLGDAALGQAWQEAAKLSASNAMAYDRFGGAASIWGDTAVVGARWGDGPVQNSGAAYVFERGQGGPGAWGEVQNLAPLGGKDGDWFGISVAVDRDTIVVGADHQDDMGAAHVFRRDPSDPTAWLASTVLFAPDPMINDEFGSAVDVEGDWIVVGSRTDDYQFLSLPGSAYLFHRDQGGPGQWGQVAHVKPINAATGDLFGGAVSLSGDVLVVGADGDEVAGVDVGSAFVFRKDLGGVNSWGHERKIKSPDGADGDRFGDTVAAWGDTIAVGAPSHDHAGGTGAVYVFERDIGGPSKWGLKVKLVASDGSDGFGASISIWGDTLAVGDPSDDEVWNHAGAIYVFRRDSGGNWIETDKLVSPNFYAEDGLGGAVGLWGNRVVGGAIGDPTAGGYTSGAAHLFEGPPAVNYCTAGLSASGCQALLSATGTPSASAASGFVVAAAGVEGTVSGTLFFGPNGRQANPWGNGTSFQCVVPPVKRTGQLAAGGTQFACDGSVSQDLNAHWCPTCPKPHHNPGAGALVQAQLWYRDPQSSSNQTTGLSDAIEFTLAP